jgi:hypothetical protein
MQWLKDIVKHNIEGRTASDARTWAEDVRNYGCAGGSVSGLIWYSETEKIYRDNEYDIIEALDNAGYYDDCGKKDLIRRTIVQICNDSVWAIFEMCVQDYTEQMIEELNLSDEE